MRIDIMRQLEIGAFVYRGSTRYCGCAPFLLRYVFVNLASASYDSSFSLDSVRLLNIGAVADTNNSSSLHYLLLGSLPKKKWLEAKN